MAHEFRVDVLQTPNAAGVTTTVTADADDMNNMTTRKQVTNPTGGDYAAGDLVYISGNDGTYDEVTLADGDDALSMATHACATAILAGLQGYVDSVITIVGLDTSLAPSAPATGDPVYLTATATTTNTWDYTPLPGASQVDQVCGMVSVVDAAVGAVSFIIGEGKFRSVGTDALMDGVFSADAAGRALMATDYIDAATALAKIAANALDNTAVANAFAADSITNAEVGIFQDNFLAADATSRAKISTNFFDAATVLDLFNAGAFDNTAVANAFAAASFTNAEVATFQDAFFAADDASRAKLAANFLGTSVIGRALMQTGYFDAATALDKFGVASMDATFCNSALDAAAIAAEKVNVDLFATASVTIPGGNGAGNVGDLMSTAVEIIPAPGGGTYIQPIAFTLSFTYSTAAYDGAGAGNDIVFVYGGGGAQELGRCDNGNGGAVMFARAAGGTDVRHVESTAVAALGTVAEFIPEEATAVNIQVLGADPFAAAGAGELKVNAFYRVLPYTL